jgi:hypothetical protein
MENSQKSAFAAASEVIHQSGLTKREYFAGLAMQGLLASNGDVKYIVKTNDRDIFTLTAQTLAKDAILLADVLLKELDNTK